MGDHGHLRVRRSQSFKHPARSAYRIELAESGWFVGRAGNYRHRISGRVLFEVRHVPPKFPPPRARDLRELPERLHHAARFLSSEVIWRDGLRPVLREKADDTEVVPPSKIDMCSAAED